MSRSSSSQAFQLCFVLTAALLAAAHPVSAVFAQSRHTSTHRSASRPAPAEAIKNVFWQPNQLVQGSPVFITVELDRAPRRVTGTWIGKSITFLPKPDDPKVWYALAGADLETQPGPYDLKISAVLPNGRIASSTKPIGIGPGDFKTGSIDVPENFVEPDPAGKRQIAADSVLKTRAYARTAPRPLWSGNFIKPVEGPSTATFGESRILNEEKSSTHRGTDFPVKEGTSVVASNTGTVVLAKELFYEGNCVILDHGDHLYSIYMHLSRTDVRPGDKVEKGDKLGLSGATGRVTGPHMHFGVRWNGAYLNPVQLLALTLPGTASTSAVSHTASHSRSSPTRRHTR
ncbi:MAG TPA: M23 family metallopeptidase [Acidobacteriaceae bacterium]|jgi:murein DD-endopeptidase MepM/ murein hydrolase activator NlpD|nr:M23 family metallopeptidase [Acidobacteriaceae bacterium]